MSRRFNVSFPNRDTLAPPLVRPIRGERFRLSEERGTGSLGRSDGMEGEMQRGGEDFFEERDVSRASARREARLHHLEKSHRRTYLLVGVHDAQRSEG
jgi:hypothetical protein